MSNTQADQIAELVRQYAEALDWTDMYLARNDYEMSTFWQGRANVTQAQLEDMGAIIRDGVVTWPKNGQA